MPHQEGEVRSPSGRILERIKNEPVVLTSLVAAIINLVVTLGYLSSNQGDQVKSVLDSLIILILGFASRQFVTPTRKGRQSGQKD
ncbi:hypothetical protein [Rubrobacter calidifluminis]|uniref:hypothetical protein n=1 Tax=Rubrobacter calidifluminis TaxID=1392640 RepID=UPI00235FF26C|nr:hypothetical protein [Rubrobacter calidifluminis]